MNAHCGRFNRTVQEEWIDYHYDLLLLDNPTDFKLELLRWLSWYNLGARISARPSAFPTADPRAGSRPYNFSTSFLSAICAGPVKRLDRPD